MTRFFYALGDIFQATFSLMNYKVGNVVNVIFIAIITFFIVYWIREMQRNPDKARH